MEIDIGLALTIGAVAFGAWAFVVKTEIAKFRSDLRHFTDRFEKSLGDVAEGLKETSVTLVNHVNHTERRLTMLETEFGFIRRYLGKGNESEE